MSKFPITSTAFEKLKEEIHYLKYTERPNISKSIAEAREFGDLSENAEYHAAREKQAFIESRINDFEDKLARAEVIHIGKIASDKVTFGATVKMKDDDTEEILNYMIVGEYEADISKYRISIVSPIARALIGKKVGDVITMKTNGLFHDAHKLMDYLNVSHDVVHDLDVEVTFTIDEVVAHEPADLNQELFDKLFGPGAVTSVGEVKEKIKEDAEKHFATQSEQKLMADVQDFLIENTKFDLPKEFLVRWLQTVGEKKLSAEEAEVEYNRSEKGLRFQLIEGKALAQSNIQITFEDLKAFTANAIRKQMAQYGQMNPTDEEVEGIVARVLSNQEEVKKLSEQVVAEKMLQLFKEKANPKAKKVTYEQFVAAMYNE